MLSQVPVHILKLAGGDESVISGNAAVAAGASAALVTKSKTIIPETVSVRLLYRMVDMLRFFGFPKNIPAYNSAPKKLTEKELNRLKPFVIS